MYKRIDLTKLGGYPLAQEDLDWLQSSYRDTFSAMANFIGDKTIITGMAEAGGNVTAGWVCIGNEILPFLAGTIGSGEFMIDELITPLVFDDGVSKDVLYERVAKFSVTGTYNYADLKRLSTVKDMWAIGDVKEVDCTMAYLAENFDVTGLGINERTGWAICNGNNGTKNRGGKVSVGFNPADVDFDDTDKTGGLKEVVLTWPQLPSLSANQGIVKITGNNTFTTGDSSGGEFDNKDMHTWAGADAPHNNMQPYQVTLFIQKL